MTLNCICSLWIIPNTVSLANPSHKLQTCNQNVSLLNTLPLNVKRMHISVLHGLYFSHSLHNDWDCHLLPLPTDLQVSWHSLWELKQERDEHKFFLSSNWEWSRNTKCDWKLCKDWRKYNPVSAIFSVLSGHPTSFFTYWLQCHWKN